MEPVGCFSGSDALISFPEALWRFPEWKIAQLGNPALWPNHPGQTEGIPVAVIQRLPCLSLVITDVRTVGPHRYPGFGIRIPSHCRAIAMGRLRGGRPMRAAVTAPGRSPGGFIGFGVVSAYGDENGAAARVISKRKNACGITGVCEWNGSALPLFRHFDWCSRFGRKIYSTCEGLAIDEGPSCAEHDWLLGPAEQGRIARCESALCLAVRFQTGSF